MEAPMVDDADARALDALCDVARSVEPPSLGELEARRMVRSALDRAELRSRRRKSALRAALAVAALLVVAFVSRALWSAADSTHVVVRPDDRPLRLTLSGGDVVVAMPGSELALPTPRAAFRAVRLESGSALFSVQKGRGGFTVDAGSVQVRVLGTVFSVAHGPSGVIVHVLEGRVSVAGRTLEAPAHWAERGEPLLPRPLEELGRALVVERAPAAPQQTVPAPRAEPRVLVAPRPEMVPPARGGAEAEQLEGVALRKELALADALRGAGRTCEAGAAYARYVGRIRGEGGVTSPRSMAAHVLRAAQLTLDGCADPGRAADILRKAGATDQDAPLRERATALLVDALLAAGKPDEARSWARTYLEREPNTATSRRMRALITP
jgi:FecR protein/Tetratricopeptide repeat